MLLLLLFVSTLTLFNPVLLVAVAEGGDLVEPGEEEFVFRDESIINLCAAVGDFAFSILLLPVLFLSADKRALTPLLLSDPIWLQVWASRAKGLFFASS